MQTWKKRLAVIDAQREAPETKERIEELRQRTERNQDRPGGRAEGESRDGKTVGGEEGGTRKGRQACEAVCCNRHPAATLPPVAMPGQPGIAVIIPLDLSVV